MRANVVAPEFQLLVRCCGWNFIRNNPDPVVIPGGLNWDLVVLLARRHRVQGLVWNALSKHAELLPIHARDALSADARAIAATNLAIAGECRAIQADWDEAGIPLLFIKGLTLGALAYRSPSLKMGWDIDLLIDPDDLEDAARLLEIRGYTLRIPRRHRQLHKWHQRSKESVWSRDGAFHVELHTRLSDNPRLIPTVGMNSHRQAVSCVPGVLLPTLEMDELFAYLAVHGASSAWFRLKWIADFAALFHGQGSEELARLYRMSQELGAGRAAGQALLLADALFSAMEVSSDFRTQIERDPRNKWLARAALNLMTKDVREPTGRRLGTLPIHLTQFFLRPGWAFKGSEAARQILAVASR